MSENKVLLDVRLNRDGLQRDVAAGKVDVSRLKDGLSLQGKVTVDTAAANAQLKETRSLLDDIKSGFGIAIADRAISGVQGLVGGLVDFGKESLAASDRANTLKNSYEGLLGSAEKAKETLKELRTFADITPLTTDQTLSAAQQLLTANVAANELIPTLRRIGDTSQGSADKFQGLVKAYSDVLTAGQLYGQDQLQFQARGINIYREIADLTGKSVSEIRKLGEQGGITSDLVVKAFERMTSEGGKFYNQMAAGAVNFEVSTSTLTSKLEQLSAKFGAAITPAAKAVVDLAANAIDFGEENPFADLAKESANFAEELGRDKELVAALKEGSAEAAKVLGGTLLEGARSLTNALKENPKLLAEAVKGAVDLTKQVAAAAAEAAKFAGFVGEGYAKIGQYTKRTGLAGFERSTVIEESGGDVQELNNRILARLEKFSLLDTVANPFNRKDQKVIDQEFERYFNELQARKTQLQPFGPPAPSTTSSKPTPEKPGTASLPKPPVEPLKAFGTEFDQRAALLERSRQDQEIALRRDQLSGKTSEKQATAELEKIRSEATQKAIDLKRREITELRSLLESKKIDQQKYNSEEFRLGSELNKLIEGQQRDALESQKTAIEERKRQLEKQTKAEVEAIAAQAKARETALQGKSQGLDFQAAGLGRGASLDDAKANLSSKQLELERQRLEFAIAQAEKDGRSVQAAQLRAALTENQRRTLDLQLKTQEKQLEVDIKRQAIDLGKQKIQADIAVVESKTELLTAQKEKRSQAELNNLRELLNLREQARAEIDKEAANLSEVNKLRKDALNVDKEISRERQAQTEALERQRQQSQGTGESSPRTSSGFAVFGDQQTQLRAAEDFAKSIRDSTRGGTQEDIARELLKRVPTANQDLFKNPFLGGELSNVGLPPEFGQLLAQSQANNKDSLAVLKEIAAKLGSGPRNLTVVSQQPVLDAAGIYQDMERYG